MMILASAPYGLALTVGFVTIAVALALVAVIVVVLVKALRKRNQKPVEAAQPEVVEESPAIAQPVAPGSAGGIKLHDVEPKTAAMLMAIVADKMNKPLNELRFISIKEVK